MSRIEVEPTQIAAEKAPAASPAARPWQFSLRQAFWFLTIAAGAAALARFKGLGSLVLSAGLFLSWLNLRGYFERVQTRRARPKVFYAGWLLLGVSLFLPAMKGCNNSTLAGWETAYGAVLLEADVAERLVVQRDGPGSDELLETLAAAGWITLLNAANLLALLSPWLLWRLQRDKGQRLGAALAVSAVAVWTVPLGDSQMLIGCYVWCAGFLTLTLSYRLGWRTFLAMTALGTACVAL